MATKKQAPTKEFLEWLKEEKTDARHDAMGSASAWNHAYSSALNMVYREANKLFGNKKNKKTVTKSTNKRLSNR